MGFIKKLKKIFGLEDEPITDSVPEPEPGPGQETKPVVQQENAKVKPPAAALPPAPEKRDEIVRFILHSLRPYMDEKDHSVVGLRFYILCATNEEEELAKVALYADKRDKFKNDELRRKLANNFIQLPEQWFFEYTIVRDRLPECRFQQGRFGLDIIDSFQQDKNLSLAKLVPLEGQTAESEYQLDPGKKQKYFIGRGKNPVLESGRTHPNDIVFLDKEETGFDEAKGRCNLFVSRNHAFIVYDPYQRRYFLYADKGGVPASGNKTKILKAGEGDKIIRVDILGAAHELADGDQIELGGEARLLFSTCFITSVKG